MHLFAFFFFFQVPAVEYHAVTVHISSIHSIYWIHNAKKCLYSLQNTNIDNVKPSSTCQQKALLYVTWSVFLSVFLLIFAGDTAGHPRPKRPTSGPEFLHQHPSGHGEIGLLSFVCVGFLLLFFHHASMVCYYSSSNISVCSVVRYDQQEVVETTKFDILALQPILYCCYIKFSLKA